MKLTRPKRWQMQDAKARLSRVVKEARSDGPQIITLRGEDVAAVIPIADLPHVLAADRRDAERKGAILDTLQRCPYPLGDLDLHRDRTAMSAKSIFGE
jgi:prevent-host-death family protein